MTEHSANSSRAIRDQCNPAPLHTCSSTPNRFRKPPSLRPYHATLIVALICAFFSFRPIASAGPLNGEFQINATAGQMIGPAIATAPDGSFTVVWKGKISTEDIWARRFDAAGTALGGEFQINGSAGKHQKPAISMASDGSFVVVWELKVSDTVFNVLARRFDAVGTALGAEFQINVATGEMRDPAVATAPDDSFTVVWHNNVSGTTEEIWARRFDAAGTALGGDFQINTSAGKHNAPTITMASDGSFVVVWEYKDAKTILARRYDAAGTALGGEFQINLATNDMKEPAVAAAPDDSFTVVWNRKVSGTIEEIWARQFDAAGTALGGDFQISGSGGKDQRPTIAMASDGSFAVVWEHTVTNWAPEIWARRFDASGNALAGEYQVNVSTAEMKEPAVAAALNDNFMVVWGKKVSGNEEIWARWIGDITLEETITGGNASISPVTLPLINGGTDQTYVLAIATKSNNDVTAVTGGGLSWTEQVEQCATSNMTAMRIWTAQGSPGVSFQVQITYVDGLPLTSVLSRYSGVGGISDSTGENPAGESGSCAAGPSTASAQLTLTSTEPRSVHVLGVAPGDQTVTSVSPGYTLNGADVYGGGGNTTNAYMYEKAFDPAATDTFQATLSGSTWWATGGVVLSPGAPPPAPTVFADVSSALGFDVKTSGDRPSGLNFADYDNDGDLDAIITGKSFARVLTNINEGQSFTDVKLAGGNRPGQGAMIDIDNDADLDFWHNQEKLFENNGGAAFTDAGDLGFGNASSTSGVAAADIDADGYADLLMFSKNGNWIGFHGGRVAETLAGTDEPSYGFNDPGSVGEGGFCASGDVNNDRRLDFYYHYNNGRLFLSNGDGTYTQNPSGISVDTNKDKPVGAAWADYDNDGDLDLFVPRFDSGGGGYLWRNDGGTFTDVAASAGIANTSGQRGCAWGDYDNDGDLDLYICVENDVNVLYQNQGDGTFASVFVGANVAGNSQDAVFVDYDNDGDLDLAVTQDGTTNVLLQNSTDDTNYLKVRVIGHGRTMTNKAAIGVRVDLYAANGTTFLARREIATARGYGGTEPIWVHFGGVVNSTTYVVKVHFVGGITEVTVVPEAVSTTIASVTIAQMLTVVEGNPRLAGWREVEPD